MAWLHPLQCLQLASACVILLHLFNRLSSHFRTSGYSISKSSAFCCVSGSRSSDSRASTDSHVQGSSTNQVDLRHAIARPSNLDGFSRACHLPDPLDAECGVSMLSGTRPEDVCGCGWIVTSWNGIAQSNLKFTNTRRPASREQHV